MVTQLDTPHPVAESTTQPPTAPITAILVAVNAAVFVRMLLAGVYATETNPATLVAWGANYPPQTTDAQWWRLLTCMFLHADPLHLLANMSLLFWIGRVVERQVGSSGFLFVYLFCGLFGAIISSIWNPHSVSVGASAAVLGVAGVLFACLPRRHGTDTNHVNWPGCRFVLVAIAVDFVVSLFLPSVDVAAHIGGLSAGVFSGLVARRTLANQRTRARLTVLRTMLAVSTPLMVAGLLTMPRGLVDWHAELTRLAKVERELSGRLDAALEQLHSHQTSPRSLADLVEHEILPKWRTARARFPGNSCETTRQREFVNSVDAYVQLREEAWVLVGQVMRSNDSPAEARFRQRLMAVQERLRELSGPQSRYHPI